MDTIHPDCTHRTLSTAQKALKWLTIVALVLQAVPVLSMAVRIALLATAGVLLLIQLVAFVLAKRLSRGAREERIG